MKRTTSDRRRQILRRMAGLTGLALVLPASASETPEGRKSGPGVVYHVDDTATQAIAAIRNIRNHREQAPGLPIRVVTLANGIDWLLEGAQDDRGNDYAALIDGLMFDGVSFAVCRNTLDTRELSEDDVHFGVELVTSGVHEITRLQLEQGYAYLKP
jgi:intracellular sulfur oxidation DsrE/DsrF family protein